MLELGCSKGQSSLPEDCHHGASNAVCLYRWTVENISVQDDAVTEGSAEDRIGQGELTVNCQQGPAGALLVVNVLVTAAGGDGGAMDIPRHAIARLGVDGRSSSPLEPSSAAREPKPFTLVLGLGIGCSIIMSGLVLQEEQHRPPLPITGKHSRNNGRDRTVGGTENPSFNVSDRDAAAAAVRADCSAKPPTLQPVALPIATPERRRLDPTEFVTLPSPASAAVPPLSDGDNDRESRYLLLAMEVPDPVLAKLVHDFDHGGVDSGPRGLSSSSCPSPSCSKPPPSAACNSGSDGIGAEDVEVPHAPSATVCRNGGGSGVAGSDEGQPAPADPVCMVKPATGTKQREDDASQRLSISAGYPSSASESGAAGRGREETGERSEAFRGGDGDSGDSESGGGKASGGGGGREKSQGVALPKKVEEVDVPDGEWRRPLVVSPPNRRRSAAGRRRPKVRDGSRNGSGGSVVLRLDHDSDDEGDRRVLSCSNGGATTRAGIDKLGAVAAGQCTMRIGGGDVGSGVGCGGGAGGGGEHEGRPEERLKKRPLAAGGSRKRSKTTPPPPPPPSSSWRALRRALHERYRDSEEHKAAEQTEADARGTNGGRGGWGGEVMSPGLRVFRRQEQAFTYADALGARLAPGDAARYKVLSFETSATGSRKFLVCDVRRFEEHYPFTALPDQSLLRHLRHEPVPRKPHHPSPTSPSLTSPQQELSCPGAVDAGGGRGGGSDEPSDGFESQTNGTSFCPSATTTTPPLQLGVPNKQQQEQTQHQQQQQRTALSVREEGSAAKVSAAVPLRRQPESAPGPSSCSPSPSQCPLGHVYEIIREGCPCRMYFDLEFVCDCNPGLDGEELVRSWINVVAGKLHQDFGIGVGGANFLDLDSSTPKKFSRHLILHLPGDQLFQDNSHVGRFVNSLADDLESWRPPPPQLAAGPPSSGSSGGSAVPTAAASPMAADTREATVDASERPGTSGCTNDDDDGDGGGSESGGGALARLWVKDADGRSVLFADVSVYTRNRCFRLLGSSKFGKSAALRVAETNRRPLKNMVWRGKGGVLPRASSPQPRDVARTLLHDSLVVPVTLRPTEEQFLTVGGGAGQHRYSRFGRNQTHPAPSRGQQQQQQQQQWSEHSAMSSDKGGRCCSCYGLEGQGRGSSCSRQGSSQGRCGGDGSGWKVMSQGFGVSPFSAVDTFLRTLICQGGTRGDLRQWSYTAGEVPPLPQHRGDFEDGGVGAASARPRSESAPPVGVVRKLTHQVANNRWCWNIGRAHKSNHVFLVTDLSKAEVRQHCHDQECRRSGYRSNPVRLPPGVAPSKDDLEAFELELGLAAAMRESPADWAAVA